MARNDKEIIRDVKKFFLDEIADYARNNAHWTEGTSYGEELRRILRNLLIIEGYNECDECGEFKCWCKDDD